MIQLSRAVSGDTAANQLDSMLSIEPFSGTLNLLAMFSLYLITVQNSLEIAQARIPSTRALSPKCCMKLTQNFNDQESTDFSILPLLIQRAKAPCTTIDAKRIKTCYNSPSCHSHTFRVFN